MSMTYYTVDDLRPVSYTHLENPRQLEEYQKMPDQGMTMGGIK